MESPRDGFLFVIIELFRHLLRLRRYKRKSVEVGVFRRGWVTLSTNFRGKRASLTNQCWCQKNRVTALPCGIKIPAVHCLILSQSTRVTDRPTDRKTERWTDRITTANTALACDACVAQKKTHQDRRVILSPFCRKFISALSDYTINGQNRTRLDKVSANIKSTCTFFAFQYMFCLVFYQCRR